MALTLAFTSSVAVTAKRAHAAHARRLRPVVPPSHGPPLDPLYRRATLVPHAAVSPPSAPSPSDGTAAAAAAAATPSTPPSVASPRLTLTPVLLIITATITGIPTLIIMLLLSPLLLLDLPRRRLHAQLTRLWLRLSLRLAGIRPRYHMPRTALQRGSLLIANRQSVLDALALATLPATPRILLPPRLASTPLLSWLFRLSGHPAIHAPGDRAALSRALSNVASMLQAGVSVALFPEGKPGPGGRPGRFLTPVFKVARQTGAPVVPVSMSGGARICPDGVVPMRRGVIDMVVHPPMQDMESEKEMAARAFDTINAGLAEEYQVPLKKV